MNNCPVCNGNDGNTPCAYPSEKMEGCLRDKRFKLPFESDWNEYVLFADNSLDSAMSEQAAFIFAWDKQQERIDELEDQLASLIKEYNL
jgi:hypothetical protein